MGKRDLDLKSYLSDKRRYADIYNGSIFRGGQLLKAEELRKGGVRPSEVTAGEYLYKFRKGERIYPVNTLIVYWGKEPWDGPKSLHDLLDFGNQDTRLQNELKRLVPEYPLHILDLNAVTDYSKFQAELRTVFELYRYRNAKKEFREYIESHEECRHLDEESVRIIGRFTNTEKLLLKASKEREGKGMDVGTAIWDIREEGVQEGISQGIRALVETCEEFGCSKEEIVLRLMKKFSMSQREAERCVEERV